MITKCMKIGAALVASLSLVACGSAAAETKTKTESGYQAVFLDSGAVFFGQLEGAGQPNPVLMHAFYVKSEVNPETKQTSAVLIRRGQEWHGPDKMTLNASHILFVETVGASSQVGQLIAKANQ